MVTCVHVGNCHQKRKASSVVILCRNCSYTIWLRFYQVRTHKLNETLTQTRFIRLSMFNLLHAIDTNINSSIYLFSVFIIILFFPMIYDTLNSLVNLLHKYTEIVNYDFIMWISWPFFMMLWQHRCATLDTRIMRSIIIIFLFSHTHTQVYCQLNRIVSLLQETNWHAHSYWQSKADND